MSGRRTIGELAAAEQVQPSTISRVIRQMKADGLVARERGQTGVLEILERL